MMFSVAVKGVFCHFCFSIKMKVLVYFFGTLCAVNAGVICEYSCLVVTIFIYLGNKTSGNPKSFVQFNIYCSCPF